MALIYTTQVSGDYACTFVSENLNSIMGYAPWEMRDDKKFWVKRLHPEDSDRVFAELGRLVEQGRGASNIASAIATGITSGSKTRSLCPTTRKGSPRRS